MAGEWHRLLWVYKPKKGWSLKGINPIAIYFGSNGQFWASGDASKWTYVTSTPYGSTDWYAKAHDAYERVRENKQSYREQWEDLYRIYDELKDYAHGSIGYVQPGCDCSFCQKFNTASAAEPQQEHKWSQEYPQSWVDSNDLK